MKKHFVSILLFCLIVSKALSQISPPGLGKAKTADWFAFGVRQELDTIEGKGWQSMSYIGIGRKSNPDNSDPLFKQAILVLNQEFYHQFHNHWQYSLALSYRKQDQYTQSSPFEHDTPRTQQEFRLYSRLSYIYKTPRIKFVPTFREEFRRFGTPLFENIDESFQLRSRFRLQLTMKYGSMRTHKATASVEELFSITKGVQPNSWTNFKYKESRFLLYYSYLPKTIPFIFSVGYMNNLVGRKQTYDVHYLAFDIVIENPFKLQQRDKDNIKDNFE